MAVPTITITCSSFTDSTSKQVLCQRVVAAHKRDVIAEPNAVGTSIVEAQTQSYENPSYSLQGIQFVEDKTTLTYKNAVELMKHQYDGTNAPTLTITYGNPSSSVGQTLGSYLGTTSTTLTTLDSLTINTFVASFRFEALVSGGTGQVEATFFYEDATTNSDTVNITSTARATYSISNPTNKRVSAITIKAKAAADNDIDIFGGTALGGVREVTNNAGALGGISVVAEAFNCTFDAANSKGSYVPTGTLTLRETA